jgi:ATP-dependent RNA helicase RhlE
VEIFVLDEADRMLDMGFIHDIKKVLAVLPPKKQSLLFSATFSDEIKQLADRLLNKPGLIEVARRNQTNEMIEQAVHPVSRDRKKQLLSHLIKSGDWHQVLVFTRMKHGANRLAEYLNENDISAMAIHGNKSQTARTRALAEFKAGSLQVLVATDIAARGIDIDQLPHVVNFELPNVPEDYVHRIGRTGRAGAQGRAVSLVCVDEDIFLREIEKLIKRAIPREVIAGFEPDPSERAEPIVLGRTSIGVRGPSSGGRGTGGGHARSGSGDRHGSGGGGGGDRGGRAPARPGGGTSSGRPAPRPQGPSGSHSGAKPAHSGHGGAKPAGSGGGGGRPAGAGSGRPQQARPALTSSNKGPSTKR